MIHKKEVFVIFKSNDTLVRANYKAVLSKTMRLDITKQSLRMQRKRMLNKRIISLARNISAHAEKTQW